MTKKQREKRALKSRRKKKLAKPVTIEEELQKGDGEEPPEMFPADPCARCEHARGWHRVITGEKVEMGPCQWEGGDGCECSCFVYPAVPDDVAPDQPDDASQPLQSMVVMGITITRKMERDLIELVESGFYGRRVEEAAERVLAEALRTKPTTERDAQPINWNVRVRDPSTGELKE